MPNEILRPRLDQRSSSLLSELKGFVQLPSSKEGRHRAKCGLSRSLAGRGISDPAPVGRLGLAHRPSRGNTIPIARG